MIQLPYDKVKEQSFGAYETACLDIFVQTGLVDVLLENPDGISLVSLGSKLDLDPRKLEPILHFLSTDGYVYEARPNIFRPCRSAYQLSKGKQARTWAMYVVASPPYLTVR